MAAVDHRAHPQGLARRHYLLKLVSSVGGQAYIPLIVRNDASHAALVIQHQVTTWQAYNTWGGRSLYVGPDGSSRRAHAWSRSIVRTEAAAPAGC